MNINDSIIISSTIKEQVALVDGAGTSYNFWMYIAIIEFVIIILLFLLLKFGKQNKSLSKFREEALAQEVDFNNIINSSFNARTLYDSLKVKCHPDRFVSDNTKFETATLIFQEITKNKNNLNRLEELKQEAITHLNIDL